MNKDYVEVLKSKPHNTKYLKRYIAFIDSRSTRELKTNFEKHHICPKAKDLFPEFRVSTEHPWNVINLTFREHYIAHMLLWKMYGGSQSKAFWLMAKRSKNKECNSRIFEKLREDRLAYIAATPGSMLGKKHSLKTKQKMSNQKLGKKFNQEHKQNIANSLRGKPLGIQAKEKMQETRRKTEGTYTKLATFDIVELYKSTSLFELVQITKISARTLKKELLKAGVTIRTRKETEELKRKIRTCQ
jgi:hypothetical protein